MKWFLVVLLLATPVLAHDWYPNDCCSGTDCQRAKAYVGEDGLWMVWVKEANRFFVVPRSQVRYSPKPPDDMCHACYKYNEQWRTTNIYCFFPCGDRS